MFSTDKAVLLSINPHWCELIASGKKTVEVRSTRPKCETPFKCYIYCTKNNKRGISAYESAYLNGSGDVKNGSGKVIGEFVCDYICGHLGKFSEDTFNLFMDTKLSCLSVDEWNNYIGNGWGWCWHISDLVIYDKPKELSEFYKKCESAMCEGCEHLKYQSVNASEYDYDCEYLGGKIPIPRPPQSWCYVEGVK